MERLQPISFWEGVRQQTRWGKYLTAIEERAVHTAMRAARQPAVALEIGAEAGFWAKLLADHGWKVICTDVDPRVLEMCKQRVPSATCILVSQESTTLPCETASINLIVCIEVAEVINSHWFFAEASRVLRPGGIVVGVANNKSSLRAYAYKALRILDPQRRTYSEDAFLYRFPYRQWKENFINTGFRFLHEEGMGWLPFPRKSNFRLIPQLTSLEQKLGLRHMPNLSPWIAFVAQKNQP